jgi:threonine synthase
MFTAGLTGLGFVAENSTLAEGVKVRFPVRSEAVLRAITTSKGTIITVDEDEIITGRDELAQRGFYVEPTSAIVWGALKSCASLPEPVVVMLTGSGFKYSSNKQEKKEIYQVA